MDGSGSRRSIDIAATQCRLNCGMIVEVCRVNYERHDAARPKQPKFVVVYHCPAPDECFLLIATLSRCKSGIVRLARQLLIDHYNKQKEPRGLGPRRFPSALNMC